MLYRLTEKREALRRMLWDNPDGIPPQDILDAIGPGALGVFRQSSELEAFLGAVAPERLGDDRGSRNEFTVRGGGTIVLGKKKEQV